MLPLLATRPQSRKPTGLDNDRVVVQPEFWSNNNLANDGDW